LVFYLLFYQEDFFIPGISPWFAISRKQMRHKPNFLIYALFLPQRKQRLTMRLLYFGFFFDLAICAFVAISFFFLACPVVKSEGFILSGIWLFGLL
jgi:hypothetical protein